MQPIKNGVKMKALGWKTLINLWPPFLASGIKITYLSDDFSVVRVRLRGHWFNKSASGAHYGGLLFSMVDAWPAFLLMRRLGKEFRIWDQKAQIEYLAQARGDITGEYRLNNELIDRIRQATTNGDKYLFDVDQDLLDSSRTLVARVSKTVYVRQRSRSFNTLKSERN